METQIRNVEQLLDKGEPLPSGGWNLRIVQSEECQSYVAWNDQSREALVIDPKVEDWNAYLTLAKELTGYLWLGVIDTHTHADHISVAARLASELQAPLVMHEDAPSRRVHLRTGSQAILPANAGPVQMLHTPGHTPDGIVVLWGPYLFAGDTLLYGDTGRDDLPGGDPEAHYVSLQRIKEVAQPETLILPGHDNKGGRISTWKSQLKLNSSLTQIRTDFVREAAAFQTAAPRLLKESLRENFR